MRINNHLPPTLVGIVLLGAATSLAGERVLESPARAGSRAAASEITFVPGDDLVGRFQWVGEVHESSFSAYPGLKFRVKLMAKTPGQQVRVSILNEGHEEVASWEIAGSSIGKAHKKQLTEGGTYLLRIENTGQVTGNYVLRTKRKLAPMAKAGTLNLKSPGDGRANGFEVIGLAGASLDLTIKPSGKYDPRSSITLIDPHGSTSDLTSHFTELGNGKIALDDVELADAGEYEIVFDGLRETGAKVKVKFEVDQPAEKNVLMIDAPGRSRE